MKKDYFAPHIRLVHQLRVFGLFFDINARLPLAWLRHHVAKLSDDKRKLDYIRSLIDECIELRRDGHEPAHKEERYL